MVRPDLQDAARKLLRMLESEDSDGSPLLSELWTGYYQTEARHLRSAERSEWAWSEMRGRVGADDVALENRQALSVTSEIVEDIRTQLRGTVSRRGKVYGPATVNRHLVVLRRLLSWAHEQRRIPYNPLPSLAMEPEHNIRHGKLRTEDELQRLLSHCKPVLKGLVLTLWDAGMRKSEVIGLRRDRVFKKPGGGAIVELSGDETKTGEPRQPHLTKRAVEALEAIPSGSVHYFARPSGKRYSPRYLYSLFEEARDKAGFTTIQGDPITLHSLRHSCAYTMRAYDHAPVAVIMRQCGWKTDICVRRYGDPDGDELSSQMAVREARIASERKGPQRAPATEEMGAQEKCEANG